jgi:signal transduction histidine kinase
MPNSRGAGGPVRISVKAEDNGLIVDVWNSGEPIPADTIDKVIEPFWRHSVSSSRQGLGLGLHICAQIVRAHEGRISVTSSRDEGTRFIVRLPLNSLHERSPRPTETKIRLDAVRNHPAGNRQ